MSISARINVLDSTAKLEADRDASIKLLESDDIGPDFAEYLEAEVELIEDELERREADLERRDNEADLWHPRFDDDNWPSLQDRGIEPGSYAS